MSDNKCFFESCSIEDEAPTIQCRGYCRRLYHQVCIGLPRAWQSSSLSKIVKKNYICSTCTQLPSLIESIDDSWSKKFKDLECKIDDIFDKCMKKISANNDTFTEISSQLSSINNELSIRTNEDVKVNVEIDASCFKAELSDMKESINKISDKISCGKTPKTLKFNEDPHESKGGWRLLGNKKVYRNDWTEYDAKERRRTEQQKKSSKARMRKKKMTKKYATQRNFDINIRSANRHRRENTTSTDKGRHRPSLNSTLEKQMPSPVRKAIRNYQHKYNNFVSGGVYLDGKETVSNGAMNNVKTVQHGVRFPNFSMNNVSNSHHTHSNDNWCRSKNNNKNKNVGHELNCKCRSENNNKKKNVGHELNCNCQNFCLRTRNISCYNDSDTLF